MGLLSWLGGSGSPKVVDLRPAGSFATDVVGESYCQQQLSRICGGKVEDGYQKQVTAVLIPDNENPHDSNAVRVEVDGLKVGHLSRGDAVTFRTKMAKAGHPNASGRCEALINGGWDRGGGDAGHFGVKLDLNLRVVASKLVK